MDFFKQYDQIRRINRDDALARLGHDPLYSVMLLPLLLLGLALLGQQILAAARIDPRFGLWLPGALVLCVGPAIVFGIARQQSAWLFKLWIDVLPLPDEQRRQQWQRRVLRRAAGLCTALILGLVISMALARQAPSSLLIVAGLGALACALSLVGALAAGPRRSDTVIDNAPRLPRLRLPGLEPLRLRGVGAWQCRRHWSMGRVLGYVLLLGPTWLFALAIGQAQAQAAAALAVAVIAANLVFNQSLDARVLHSPVLRCLPLRPWPRFRAWLQAPLRLSAWILAGLAICSLIVLDLPLTPRELAWMSGLSLLAWMMLCLLQITVCLLCPEPGTGARLLHVSGLALFALALQSLGPPGLLLMLLVLLIISTHRIRSLG